MAGFVESFNRWRSSTVFTVSSMTIAISSDLFLYSFVIPILPYILSERVRLPPSAIQLASSHLLAFYGLSMVLLSPICGALAERFPNRKTPLLIALVAQLIATAFSAASTTLPLLYIGRLVQGVSAASIWSVGWATISDTVGTQNLGRAIGVINPCITAGNLLGPMVSGILFSKLGYWPAWSAALAVCILDVTTRVLMKEKAKDKLSTNPSPPSSDPESAEASKPLLSPSSPPITPLTDIQFFFLLLRHRRILVSLLLVLVTSTLLISFDATLPLHVSTTFSWAPSAAGLCYLALLGPGLLISPLIGLARNRIGVRWPSTLAFVLLALFLLALGRAQGSPGGKTQYILALCGVSLALELPAGVESLEGSAVVDAYEARWPGVFGDMGGYGRMYSLASCAYTVGSMVGPYLGGVLVEKVGYSGMCHVLAGGCVAMAVVAAVGMGERRGEVLEDLGKRDIEEE